MVLRVYLPLVWIILSALTSDTLAQDGQLYDAAKAGDLEQVQRLLGQGMNIDSPGRNAETPLLVASLQGHTAVVDWLLAHNADTHARNQGGFTPLHAAAYGGHRDIAELLIAKGADVNDKENRYRIAPLLAAAEENHPDVVELLLAHGADPNSKEINGVNPLSRAIWRQNESVVRLLKQQGAVCQRMLGKRLYEKCVNIDN